ncbi:MAG: peptidyl-prolyl cis-trans isomerase [Acidobacteria bacterium]|nr:peptidyl-prolyl cis-trans isomerase [Acidobacteriota bacterium]
MLKTLQKNTTLVRIFLGFVVGVIALMMVITLVPGPVGSIDERPNVVASVDGQEITLTEVNTKLQRIAGQQQIPPALRGLYARQLLDQLVFERMLEVEAKKMGIRITDEERADRIKRLLPVVFTGDTFIGMDRYAAEVQQRFNMSVEEFEELIRLSLLEDKFRRLVTDGITATPDEIQQEFRRRNEKVKIEYALVKPEELAAGIQASDTELSSYFEKNKARYPLGERRTLRYALVDTAQLSQRAGVTEQELRAYYDGHMDRYRIENRARVSHILFKTVGKTDAEAEEIRRKAEAVLKKARSGAKFEDLAKQNSADSTKDAGGDLGWIVHKQTVPEFEKAAFTLPKGSISDLVKTQYGFHIIKVVDRENARTQSFEEVRASILPILANEKADRTANEIADRMAAAVRQGGNQPIEQFARQFGVAIAEAGPVAAGVALPEFGGANAELDRALFRLNKGQLSMPIKVARGYLVFTVKEIQTARQAALADVRDKVLADYRKEKSVELAKTRAEEFAKRVHSGEALAKAAKALGLEAKTSDAFARIGSVSGVGSAQQFADAFRMAVGQSSPATAVGSNWLVYRLAEREEAKPEDFEKQKKEMEQAVLQSKRSLAYEAFRTSLEKEMRSRGKLEINEKNLLRLNVPA